MTNPGCKEMLDAVLYSLPFNFSFYGQAFDQVYVSSNGLLVFNMEYSPGGVVVVAGFWWDLVCGDCRISAAHLVEESGEMVVFQFYNMAFFDPSYPYFAGPSTVSFEIRLLLDGRIFFMYQSFPTNTASYLNALVGLETHTGDSGLSLRNALQTLFAGQTPFAVSFTPWVTAEPWTAVNVARVPDQGSAHKWHFGTRQHLKCSVRCRGPGKGRLRGVKAMLAFKM
eukprot:s778_g8.t1